MHEEVKNIKTLVPVGRDHYQAYEHMVRVAVNFLFNDELGEAIAQSRTEPGDEGLEIRDLMCANQADDGFWKDLKDKYLCTEILFEAKNKTELTRDDLRSCFKTHGTVEST